MTTKPQSTTEPPDRIWIERAKGEGYPRSTGFYTESFADGIEYARVDRKYFCSCGGALTAEEYITHYFEMGHDRGDPAVAASAAPVVDNIGLNLLRQLVGGKNSLRTLGVFSCNQAEHEDVDCKCFWEQCEAWARQDAGIAPVDQLVCAKCGKSRMGVSAESFLCRYCFSTESTAVAATAAPQVSNDLLRDAGAIIIVNEGSAGARVEIRFAELQDAQRLHQALAQMRVAAPVDHDSIPLTTYECILTIEWDKYNARRHELIKAERSRVLSESEVLELFELQWLAGVKRELAKGPHVAAPVEQSDSSIPTCPDCQQGYICEHCGKSIIDYYSGNGGAR